MGKGDVEMETQAIQRLSLNTMSNYNKEVGGARGGGWMRGKSSRRIRRLCSLMECFSGSGF